VQNVEPHWTAYLTALLTPCIAILAAYIGYQQWQLNRHKLKLDLFDKRWEVYAATNDMLASLLQGSAEDRRSRAKDFRRMLMDAKFICSKETVAFLGRIERRITEVEASERALRDTELSDPKRHLAEKRVLDEAHRCKEDYDALVTVFSRELRINF
jgi:hypothetical protein